MHDLARAFLGWLYDTDPAQPSASAGEELDDLDHDLSDLSADSLSEV